MKNYENILIPEFKTQSMISDLDKKTSRGALTWSHYLFRKRLEWSYSSNLHVITEEYTSKTCTNCGTMQDIGREKIYNCSKCKIIIDRDINGARNILLKNLPVPDRA